jgi:hypothetical protein
VNICRGKYTKKRAGTNPRPGGIQSRICREGNTEQQNISGRDSGQNMEADEAGGLSKE